MPTQTHYWVGAAQGCTGAADRGIALTEAVCQMKSVVVHWQESLNESIVHYVHEDTFAQRDHLS